jgi:PTS system nitrogen regulatory IIA component
MMLDIKEVSKLLAISEKTIYRWIARKEIPAYKIGQGYRFNRVEIMEWATSKKIAVSQDIFSDVVDKDEPDISLTDSIRSGGIHYKVSGSDIESVIKTIVTVVNLPEDVDRIQLAEAMIAREHLGTTAIGNGIAIPHVRNPIIFNINKPILALCFLENDVDFGALDKQPVDTVFTIITNTIRSHLQILSHLSYALYNPQIRQIIKSESSRDRILDTLTSFEVSIKVRQSGSAC